LYPRSSASARRTPSQLSAATKASFDEGAVVGFKDVQAGSQQIALRDHDDVIARSNLVSTEDFSNQSLRPVPFDRAAELARGGDAEPAHRTAIRQDKDRAVTTVQPGATLVDLLEFRAAANALVWAEPQLLAADGETLAAFRAPALQHQAAVLRAHTYQKPVRLLAMTVIRLKSADALGHEIPSR